MPATAKKKAPLKNQRAYIPPQKLTRRELTQAINREAAERIRANFHTLSDDLVLTEAETSAVTGKRPNTLRTWRSLGKGPEFIKLGLAVRYPVRAIRKMLAEGTP